MRILGTRILIQPTPEEKTKGGIIMPNPDNHYGVVIGVGEKQEFIKVGQKVKYHIGRGVPFEDTVFLDEKDVDVILT